MPQPSLPLANGDQWNFLKTTEDRYFVYGYGMLQGVYSKKEDATKAAREVYGLVIDEKGSKIWVFEENYQ